MSDRVEHPTERRRGVVVACRREDGRWLMMRRSEQVARAPLKVGMPGGEIEAGETQREAVVREMHEELGLRVQPLCCVWWYDLPDRPWRLFGWRAEIVGGDLKPNPEEVAEVLWLTEREAAEHPQGLPTNPLVMAALRAGGSVPMIDVKKLMTGLAALSNREFQQHAWMASSGPVVSSFVEDVCQVFDDTGLSDAIDVNRCPAELDEGVFSVLKELHVIVSNIDADVHPANLRVDGKVHEMREIAARALLLVREQWPGT